MNKENLDIWFSELSRVFGEVSACNTLALQALKEGNTEHSKELMEKAFELSKGFYDRLRETSPKGN